MPRSFEDSLIARLDREGSVIDQQHYTSDEEFNNRIAVTWNKIRPKYNDFLPRLDNKSGVTYSLDEQKRDHAIVKGIQESIDFQRERTEAAVGLEYAMMETIHEHGLLGEEAHVTPTNEYDDYINRIDFVVSMPKDSDEGEYLRFGIDTTISGDPSVIDKKLKHNIDLIKLGKLSQVKYFISDEANEHLSIEVPRFVIATSPVTALEIQKQLVNEPETVKNNVARYEILEEIEEQAVFAIYLILGNQEQLKYQSVGDSAAILEFLNQHPEQCKSSSTLDKYVAVLRYIHNLRNKQTSQVHNEYKRGHVDMIIDSLQRQSAV